MTKLDKLIILCWLILFPIAACVLGGAGTYSKTVFYDDVSVGTWSAIAGLTNHWTTGGTYTNGLYTNYYRMSGTNQRGRLPVSNVHTVEWTGTASASNAVVLRWTQKDGVEEYIIEKSTNDIDWTNWVEVGGNTWSVTNWTDTGTNITETNNFTNTYSEMDLTPSVPWSDATGGIQQIVGGDGIDVTGSGTSRTVAVDSTVLRADGSVARTGDQDYGGNSASNLASVFLTGGGPFVDFSGLRLRTSGGLFRFYDGTDDGMTLDPETGTMQLIDGQSNGYVEITSASVGAGSAPRIRLNPESDAGVEVVGGDFYGDAANAISNWAKGFFDSNVLVGTGFDIQPTKAMVSDSVPLVYTVAGDDTAAGSMRFYCDSNSDGGSFHIQVNYGGAAWSDIWSVGVGWASPTNVTVSYGDPRNNTSPQMGNDPDIGNWFFQIGDLCRLYDYGSGRFMISETTNSNPRLILYASGDIELQDVQTNGYCVISPKNQGVGFPHLRLQGDTGANVQINDILDMLTFAVSNIMEAALNASNTLAASTAWVQKEAIDRDWAGVPSEVDPVFTASAAGGITADNTNDWSKSKYYSVTFTNDDWDASGDLVVTHNLEKKESLVQIFNGSDRFIIPDLITLDTTNQCTVNIASFTNGWTGTGTVVVISDGGVSAGATGSGDFMADGSVPMTGNLNLGGNAASNGYFRGDTTDQTNYFMSRVGINTNAPATSWLVVNGDQDVYGGLSIYNNDMALGTGQGITWDAQAHHIKESSGNLEYETTGKHLFGQNVGIGTNAPTGKMEVRQTTSEDIFIAYSNMTERFKVGSGGVETFTGSDAEGDIAYYDGTNWTRLAKGTDNHVLTMNGNVPNWEAAVGGQWSADGSIGIVPNGATNSLIMVTNFTYAGIQDAIDTLGSSGGEVYLPAGTYDDANTNTISIPANVTLGGSGAATILDSSSVVQTNDAIILNGTNIIVRNLRILGNKSGGTAHNLISDDNTDCSGARLLNLQLINSDNAGIHLDNSSSSDTLISDCYTYESAAVGIRVDGTQSKIVNCTTDGDDGGGIGSYGMHNVVEGNVVISSGADGITVSGQHSTIQNNTVDAVSGDGIYCNIANLSIAGNAIFDAGNYGIYALNADHSSCNGNMISQSANNYAEIYWRSCANASVCGNALVGVGGTDYGILLDDSDNNMIANNSCAGHDVAGILEDSGSKYNMIYGNDCEDESTPYSLASTNQTPLVLNSLMGFETMRTNGPATDASRAYLWTSNSTAAELWVTDGGGNETQLSPHDGDIPIRRSYNKFTGRMYKKNLWTGEEEIGWIEPMDSWAGMHEREYLKISNIWQRAKDAYDLDPVNNTDPGPIPEDPPDPPMPQWMLDGLVARTNETPWTEVLLGELSLTPTKKQLLKDNLINLSDADINMRFPVGAGSTDQEKTQACMAFVLRYLAKKELKELRE